MRDGRRSRLWGPAMGLGVLLCLALVAGCGGGDPDATPASPSPRTATTPSTAPLPSPAPAPRTGTCHRLGYRAVTRPVDDRPPVPCRSRHTSVTFAVGRVDPLLDGHLLAIDSDHVQAQLARTCPRRLAAYLGGDATARRLSMFTTVWFGPSVDQADLGARWFRCDAIALAGDERLAVLDRDLRGILDDPAALDRYGSCGTAAPSAPSFERVACAEPHTWRAFEVVEFPSGARFLGRQAGSAADARCKDVASERAQDSLRFTWSLQWPTREQWADGQRYGYCWLPDR